MEKIITWKSHALFLRIIGFEKSLHSISSNQMLLKRLVYFHNYGEMSSGQSVLMLS